jgi:hypothetical protein
LAGDAQGVDEAPRAPTDPSDTTGEALKHPETGEATELEASRPTACVGLVVVEPLELASGGGAQSSDVVETGSLPGGETLPDGCGTSLGDAVADLAGGLLSMRVVG